MAKRADEHRRDAAGANLLRGSIDCFLALVEQGRCNHTPKMLIKAEEGWIGVSIRSRGSHGAAVWIPKPLEDSPRRVELHAGKLRDSAKPVWVACNDIRKGRNKVWETPPAHFGRSQFARTRPKHVSQHGRKGICFTK